MPKHLSEEEIALGILGIFYSEVVNRGAKRRLDFDAIINTYFYVLEKVRKKDEMLGAMKIRVVLEEKRLLHQSPKEALQSIDLLKDKIPEKR